MSATPPPFHPPYEPVKKKNNTVLIVIIVLVILAIPCVALIVLAAIGWGFAKNTVGPLVGCTIGFQEVRASLLDYAEDHGGKLPPAKTWQDEVRAYYSKASKAYDEEKGPFKENSFTADGPWGCKLEKGGMTGIAFNSNLAGKKVDDIKDPGSTIILFEVPNNGENLSEPYKVRSDSDSPTIMGDRRGWIKIAVEGDVDIAGSNSVRVKSRTSRSGGVHSAEAEEEATK